MKEARVFTNIGALVKTARANHPKAYSQSEVSHLLGYKNGQFVSNVERGLCCIPLKMLKRTCKVLNIEESKIVEAIQKDNEATIRNYLQ